jgi:hypothetical protein
VRCGVDTLEDCAIVHLARDFDMTCTAEATQWSGGRCPACGGRSCLSLAIRTNPGSRHRFLAWTCHRLPTAAHPLAACTYAEILTAVHGKRPDCVSLPKAPGRPKRAEIDPDELAALALSGMPPVSMKLAMLEMTGLGTPDALDKLGIRREHRSRVINGRAPIRVQNRR